MSMHSFGKKNGFFCQKLNIDVVPAGSLVFEIRANFSVGVVYKIVPGRHDILSWRNQKHGQTCHWVCRRPNGWTLQLGAQISILTWTIIMLNTKRLWACKSRFRVTHTNSTSYIRYLLKPLVHTGFFMGRNSCLWAEVQGLTTFGSGHDPQYSCRNIKARNSGPKYLFWRNRTRPKFWRRIRICGRTCPGHL